MTKYTADDFANAKFAEHEDGYLATRSDPNDSEKPWADGFGYWHSDQQMAAWDWVPVPTKPTITRSDYTLALNDRHSQYVFGFTDAMKKLDVEVVPDQEPTDEELLAGIIRNIDDWQSITSPELLAKYLNTAGVTPPKEDK